MKSSSSSSRAEPVILKAGIALIVSATGLIIARFMTRREDDQVTSSLSNVETSLPSGGCDDDGEEEREEQEGVMEDSEARDEKAYEREILGLRARFEELQKKENEMEMRFVHYCNLRDKESMLMELKTMLKLEKAHLYYFSREVSAMEEENKKIQDCVVVYLRLVDKVQRLRSENGLLQSKVKKLVTRTKELSCAVKEKNSRMSGLERKLLRNLEELETKSNAAKEMADEVKELKATIDRLQEEKNELLMSRSSNPKTEVEFEGTTVAVEDYKRLVGEYENLKMVRADEVKELMNLRWSNEYLRHELMRYGGHDQENRSKSEDFHPHLSLEDHMALDAIEEHREHEEHRHESSRRKRFLKRLKRLVEGHEKGKSKSEERCFGRHSLAVEPEEEQHIVLARRSCSSA